MGGNASKTARRRAQSVRMQSSNNVKLIKVTALEEDDMEESRQVPATGTGEKAEKPTNRHVTLKQDEDMEVDNGINPLELLSKKEWALVLNCVEEGKDLKSCFDTCHLFREILKDSRNTWLFTSVLPLIIGDLTFKELLKCRLICKMWKELVDQIPVTTTLTSAFLPTRSSIRDLVHKKLDEMKAHSKNPLIGGRVTIEDISLID